MSYLPKAMSGSPSNLSERLRTVRDKAGLSQGDLARRAAVDEEAIRRFEAGTVSALTTGVLIRLADILAIPRVILLNPAEPFEPGRTPHSLLKTAAVRGHGHLAENDENVLASALARARGFAELRALLKRPSLLAEFNLAPPPEAAAHEAGYQDARRVRDLLAREGPIHRLRRLVEDAFGILVVEMDFVDGDVVGAACRLDDARVIAVRRSLPTETWRRFVIGHELEHHLRDLAPAQGEVSNFAVSTRFDMEPPPIEKRANAFSAMLLAPNTAVTALLGPPKGRLAVRFDTARAWVQSVSATYGIGFAAAAWHLHNLGYYDDETVKMLTSLIDSPPPAGFEDDSPFDGLTREVFGALSTGDISLGRARDLIGPLVDRWMDEQSGGQSQPGNKVH
jgi:Zn-dependent peptidase ImmA (M78 family)/transcriptional regulator with XRE-family HTH domain